MIKGLEKNRYFPLWENFLKVNCLEMIWMVRFDGVLLLFQIEEHPNIFSCSYLKCMRLHLFDNYDSSEFLLHN